MGVEAVPLVRPIRAVDPVPVALPRPEVRKVGVPYEVGLLDHAHAPLVPAFVVEEAQLDLAGVLGEDREVDTGPIPRRTQRVGVTAPDPHGQRSDGCFMAA